MLFSSLLRKRTTSSSYRGYQWLSTLVLTAFTISCASKKPRVITTKAEAREYQMSQENESPRDTYKESIIEKSPIIVDSTVIDYEEKVLTIIDEAILYAKGYMGTKYRYGGSTHKGMDCSGLIHIAFDHVGEHVPRTSRSLFDAATVIDIKEINKGDLMFFATGRDRKKINHVALVVEVTPAEILFIHSTVSSGVIISSFNEPYWLGKYLGAGRLL